MIDSLRGILSAAEAGLAADKSKRSLSVLNLFNGRAVKVAKRRTTVNSALILLRSVCGVVAFKWSDVSVQADLNKDNFDFKARFLRKTNAQVDFSKLRVTIRKMLGQKGDLERSRRIICSRRLRPFRLLTVDCVFCIQGTWKKR